MPENYYKMFQKQPSGKVALIEDGKEYTYGELLCYAEQYPATLDNYPVVFIKSEKPSSDLIRFLSVSCQGKIPILVPGDEKRTLPITEFHPGENICMGVMTSGSTGAAKVYYRSYESWADFFPVQNAIFGLGEDTILFVHGPFGFTGNLNMVLGVFSVGGTVVTNNVLSPDIWVQSFAKYKVNAIYMIPAKLKTLVRKMKQSVDSIKTIVSGSQAMCRKDAEGLKKIFPEAKLTLYYGGSELSYISYLSGEEMTEDATNVGRLFPGVGVEIREGEIWVDTPCHVNEVSCPYSMRDCGFLAEDGSLHLTGRADDIVLVRGRKISLYRIKEVLLRVDGIEDAEVFVLEGDAIVACIVDAGIPGYTEKELHHILQEQLAAYEIPRIFQNMQELPKLESGKTDRKKLKKILISEKEKSNGL